MDVSKEQSPSQAEVNFFCVSVFCKLIYWPWLTGTDMGCVESRNVPALIVDIDKPKNF